MAQRTKYTTPIGKLGYPCAIAEPDAKYADDKNEHDLGEFKARLILPKDAPGTKAFIGMLEGLWAQHLAEVQVTLGKKKPKVDDESLPWSDEKDRETEEPTGNVVIRAKLKARVELKNNPKKPYFDQRPKVFDAKGVLVATVPAIGAGSKVRLSGQVNCWHTSKAGMTLWLEAVQLLELVERGSQSADSFGFDKEDGFTQSEFPEEPVGAVGTSTGGGDY